MVYSFAYIDETCSNGLGGLLSEKKSLEMISALKKHISKIKRAKISDEEIGIYNYNKFLITNGRHHEIKSGAIAKAKTFNNSINEKLKIK